jgi:hypothetical protein
MEVDSPTYIRSIPEVVEEGVMNELRDIIHNIDKNRVTD